MLPCLLVAQQDTRDLKTIKPNSPAATADSGPVTIPRSYALVVGISTYANLPQTAQLRYPSRDAEEMYTTLISPEGGQFPPENVHRLIGREATLANIKHELEQWLPAVTRPDDRVLIFFAGHGFVSGGRGFIAPYDVDLHNVAATAYSMDQLGQVVGSQVKGKWKVLLTDSCHSGAITPEADRAELNKTLLDLRTSLFSLTASRDRESSYESPEYGGGHGIFTYYVVQGMNGAADTNGDGVVSADELAEYVHTNVRQATKAAQNPTSERGSFDPNMVLAYNPTLRKAAALPQAQFGSLVVETNMDDTEVWVDGKNAGMVRKGSPLKLPGIAPGSHTIKGVHMGYEPDGPREQQVYPGQATTISLHILIARTRNKAAVDLLDQGIVAYKNGYEANYRKAAEDFRKAIAIDPDYSAPYVYLGRVQHALYEDNDALASFRKAIEIDPDYLEARTSYAAALLDQADFDEATRQLDFTVRRNGENGVAWYLLSQAYARKSAYAQCRDAATKAATFTPNNGEAHFWLAECQRHLNQPVDAAKEYRRYLELTNFDSGTAGKLNYYLLGSLIGMGKKTRAAQTDIWKEQRGSANLGLCECEDMQKHFASALPLCQKALSYMPNDLLANYKTAMIYIEQSNESASPALLSAARTHFQQVVATGPDTEQGTRAKTYISRIDTALAQAH
ncbi:MAG: tetratricopeptide repeat protein [Janthinobacterium lividum]